MINENKMVRYDNLCRKQRISELSDVEGLQRAFRAVANHNDIPIDFYVDEVSSGGMLSKRKDPCLCIFNPDHKTNWLNFCVKISYNGDYVNYEVYNFGKSKQMTMDTLIAMSKHSQSEKKARIDADPNSLTPKFVRKANNALLGAATRGVLGLVKGDDEKNQAEKSWYSNIIFVIDSTLAARD